LHDSDIPETTGGINNTAQLTIWPRYSLNIFFQHATKQLHANKTIKYMR